MNLQQEYPVAYRTALMQKCFEMGMSHAGYNTGSDLDARIAAAVGGVYGMDDHETDYLASVLECVTRDDLAELSKKYTNGCEAREV